MAVRSVASAGGQKRGRPARLSRELIAAAALELGTAKLSMAAVAEHLGVAKSSLYGWVSGREELLGLMADAVIERCLPAHDPVAGDWRTWLAELAWAMRHELLSVPGYAEYVAGPHQHPTGAHDRLRGRVVRVFEEQGLGHDVALQNWYVFGSGVVNWVMLEVRYVPGDGPRPRFDLFLQVLLRGLPAS